MKYILIFLLLIGCAKYDKTLNKISSLAQVEDGDDGRTADNADDNADPGNTDPDNTDPDKDDPACIDPDSGKDLCDDPFAAVCSDDSSIVGYVYKLRNGTPRLPDFSRLTHVDKICPTHIDIPEQSWSDGFPSKPDLVEWFGIRFITKLKITKAGSYTFKLNSDDGSKLYIDDNLVIDNDNQHAPTEVSNDVTLTEGLHDVTVDYFQGPRDLIALQLFYTVPDGAEVIIPKSAFVKE